MSIKSTYLISYLYILIALFTSQSEIFTLNFKNETASSRDESKASAKNINPDDTQKSSSSQTSSGSSNIFWTLFKEYIGGLQAEYTRGEAEVASFIKKGDSQKKVASGKAVQEGWKIGLNKPQKKTDFFFRLNPAFFQQRIDIKDFRKELPRAEVEGKEYLETVVTNFQTRKQVDPITPNVFGIFMQSTGLDLTAGGALNFFDDDLLALSSELIGAVTISEYRKTRITLGRKKVPDTSTAFFESWQWGFTVNAFFKKINSSLRFSVYQQFYRDVDFPKTLEFRNPEVTFNEKKNTYERKRVFVKGFNLSHITYRLTFFYIF
jgi:hypothetical protein